MKVFASYNCKEDNSIIYMYILSTSKTHKQAKISSGTKLRVQNLQQILTSLFFSQRDKDLCEPHAFYDNCHLGLVTWLVGSRMVDQLFQDRQRHGMDQYGGQRSVGMLAHGDQGLDTLQSYLTQQYRLGRQAVHCCVEYVLADIESRRRLRSVSSPSLHVPRSLHRTIGDRAFAVAAAKVWSVLPPAITSMPSLGAFKRALNCSADHTATQTIGHSSIDISVICDTQRP